MYFRRIPKERARNNLSILLPFPPGEGVGRGVINKFFERVPKYFHNTLELAQNFFVCDLKYNRLSGSS